MTKLSSPTQTISQAKCGLKKERRPLFTFSAMYEHGSRGDELIIFGRTRKTKKLKFDQSKSNCRLRRKEKGKTKLNEECTLRQLETSKFCTTSSSHGV
jgi:hypothetical protein